MSATLIVRQGSASPDEAMGVSRSALEAPLGSQAELFVLELASAATVLGAFERLETRGATPFVRRGSGGPRIDVATGTLHVMLMLQHPAALVACDPRKIVNRHVRPLLRALTKSGALASYFGRDTISVAHRPVGQVGFLHESRTKRTMFEAFVATAGPLQPSERASLLGREPTDLATATGRTFEMKTLQDRIVEAYAAMVDGAIENRALELPPSANGDAAIEPPWTARADEAIGLIGAGKDRAGVLRLGGDLLASRDAIERVEARVAALGRDAVSRTQVGEIVDEELGSSAVALDGVKDLKNLEDVLFRSL